MKKILISLFGAFLALSLLCGCVVINTPGASVSESSQASTIQSNEESSSSSSALSVEGSSESSASSEDSASSEVVESSVETPSSSEESTSSSASVSEESSSTEPVSSEESTSSSASVSEESSSQESSSSGELIVPPSLFEDGSDLATCAPFRSRAPEAYGAQSTLDIQNKVVSIDSTDALKGTFNAKGVYPYEGYMVWTWACLDLQEHFGHSLYLAGMTLTYDVKTDNCGLYSSFIVAAPNGQRTTEVSFSLADPTNAYPGITCVALEDGWFRVSLDFTEAFGDQPIIEDASEVLIMFSNQNCSNPKADSVFYIDNMHLDVIPGIEDTSSSDSSSDMTSEDDSSILDVPPELDDYDDYATSLTIRSKAPGYGAITSFSYDTEIVSEYSAASLKGVFNPKGANAYQGYMVWTWAELCLEEDFYEPVGLNDVVLYYDVLTENCGIYSSFILVAPDGTHSKEVTFAFNDPSQTNEGVTSEVLPNGWYRVAIDFSLAYAEDPSVLDEVSSILIMFTNQDCEDPNADSVFYLDNMGFTLITDEYPDLDMPVFDEEFDVASNCPVQSILVNNSDVLSTLTVQSDVVSDLLFDSTAALQGIFSGESPAKTWVAFDLEEYSYMPVCLTGAILYYDVQTINCGVECSILFVSADGTVSQEIFFNLDEEIQANDSIMCADWGNGWSAVLMDLSTLLLGDDFSLEEVSKLLISFTNEGCEDPEVDSIFYIDNMMYAAIPDEEEMEDFATNCPFESRTPTICGTSNTTCVQSEVVSENSTAALMGTFNNEGAETHDGYAVWTWTAVCLEQLVGFAVPCSDTILTYDVKTENCGIYSSFILVSPDGTHSQEITFAFNDPLQTFAGITCEELTDGWYRVTVDFNVAFAKDPSALEEVSEILIMFTNQGCENPDEDSIFYIDNMIFSDTTSTDDF